MFCLVQYGFPSSHCDVSSDNTFWLDLGKFLIEHVYILIRQKKDLPPLFITTIFAAEYKHRIVSLSSKTEMKAFLNYTILTILFLLTCCRAAYVSAKGRIVCHGRGVPYSKITMMDNDIIADTKMGEAVTGSDGHFTVSGSASDFSFSKSKRRPDVLIRMEYSHESSFARFEVKLPIYKSSEKSFTLKDREGNVDFGTIYFNTEACLTYLRFYDATKDFYSRVGYRVPFSLTIRTEYLVHGGTPYAFYKTIHLPKNTDISLSTAKHELAHTVRHHYDGSFSHFLADVAKYKYTQRHNCESKTNEGFAFNEGWAEYWASTCQTGNSSGPFDVEENVATALTKLQHQIECSTSYAQMWRVLQANPGKIHSFSDFKGYHANLYLCR